MSAHPIYRVSSYRVVGPFKLEVAFADDTKQVIDFAPVLFRVMYGPLRVLEMFNQVSVDPEVHTLVWPNGADFDPATLHDWPQYAEELAKRAQQWELASSGVAATLSV